MTEEMQEFRAWVGAVRNSLAPLEGRSVRVGNPGVPDWMWRDSQPLGWALGLTRVTPCCDESAVGECTGSEDSAINALLATADPTRLARARQIWLRVILQLFVEVWERGDGDPVLDIEELAQSWGDEAETIAYHLRKRLSFIDFGVRAHYIRRVRRLLNRALN